MTSIKYIDTVEFQSKLRSIYHTYHIPYPTSTWTRSTDTDTDTDTDTGYKHKMNSNTDCEMSSVPPQLLMIQRVGGCRMDVGWRMEERFILRPKRQQGGWNEQGDRTGMIHTNIKSDYCYCCCYCYCYCNCNCNSFFPFQTNQKMTHQIVTHVRSGTCFFVFQFFPMFVRLFEVGFFPFLCFSPS